MSAHWSIRLSVRLALGPSHFGEKFYENDAQSTGSFTYLLPLTLLFTFSLLLASLVRSAALIRSIAHSLARLLIRRRYTSKNRMRQSYHFYPICVGATAQLRSFIRSYRALIRLLHTAPFNRVLRCTHLLARSITRSLQSSWERGFQFFIYELNASISYHFNPLWMRPSDQSINP